jgi:NAD(P)H-dependent FMN reductase
VKIVVINGTDIKGCTFQIKESFLQPLQKDNIVTEFYLPSDGPSFCLGCKRCFMEGEDVCPHAAQVQPIWSAMMESDLIVFAYPVYVMRAPGQVKALLDHFGYNWMVHRPKKEMFTKRAAILTQSIGAPNKAAQKDVVTSLRWLGVSDISCRSFHLIEGVEWDQLSEKKRRKLQDRARCFGESFAADRYRKMGFHVRFYFAICRVLQKGLLKRGVESVDLKHWIREGWIQPRGN